MDKFYIRSLTFISHDIKKRLETNPPSLKILFVVLVFWTIGSVLALPGRYELRLPFFGLWLSGIAASLIVILLDIITPATFLCAVWKRKSWAQSLAFYYRGIFILNSIVALFTVQEKLGLMSILMPALFSLGFAVVIYRKRKYFV
jgi:FtsH-binding integral membrane protein